MATIININVPGQSLNHATQITNLGVGSDIELILGQSGVTGGGYKYVGEITGVQNDPSEDIWTIKVTMVYLAGGGEIFPGGVGFTEFNMTLKMTLDVGPVFIWSYEVPLNNPIGVASGQILRDDNSNIIWQPGPSGIDFDSFSLTGQVPASASGDPYVSTFL